MFGLNRLRVGPRLMLGFGVMILFLVVALVIGLSRMAMIQHNLKQIVGENYAKISLLNTMRDTVRFRGTALRDVVLQPEFGFIRNEAKLIKQARKDYQAASSALAKMVSEAADERAVLGEIEQAEAQAADGVAQVMDAALSEDTATAQTLIRDRVRERQTVLIEKIERMLANLEAESRRLAAEAAQAYRWAWGLTVAVGALSILVGSLLAWSITRGLTSRLNTAVKVASRITQGDLTGHVEVTGSDELTDLLGALAAMNQALSGLIGQASDAAHRVNDSAAGLSTTTQTVAELADSQARQVVQVGNAMQEMGTSIVQVAQDATSVAASANQARDVALEGHRNMQQSVGATERIVESVSRSSAAIDALRVQIEEISQVTQVIRDIAEQTNLLALNAAIEAARAGEQGRGFAVVADEVRKLAERTSASTGSITETVNSVSAKTAQVVEAMAKVSADVNENAEISRVTRKLLDEIVAAASEVDRLIQQIAAATRAQTEASRETTQAIERISTISDTNSAKMHNIRDAARGLSETAHTLQSLVDRFRID